MALTWIACEAMSGRLIADLPGLECRSVGQILCDVWTGTVSLPIPDAPPNWMDATEPYATYLVLLDTDTDHIFWGGWVTRRNRSHTDVVELSIASCEAYLDRIYVEDWTFQQCEQNKIASMIYYGSKGSQRRYPHLYCFTGVDNPTQNQHPPASKKRDRSFLAVDNKTVLSVWQDLAGVVDGLEFTTRWEHIYYPDKGITCTPYLHLFDHIGVEPKAGLAPAAVFECPGNVTSFELSEDWGCGRAANSVVATSSVTDGEVLQSDPHVYTDPIRPTLESRFTPSTSISEKSTLDGHAAAALAQKKQGSRALTITGVISELPALGVDWNIGDVVGIQLATPALDFIGHARCIGWELNLGEPMTITPTLVNLVEGSL